MNILDQIVINKKEEIKREKKQYPLQFFRDLLAGETSSTRDFLECIESSTHIAVIAELKFASPSRGIINKKENLEKIIRTYDAGGAKAISVLTERKFFLGESADIRKVKKISKLPVLRKDFIIDEYQIYQSRGLGANAILLIASLLDISQLRHFQEVAHSLTIDCVFEVHNERELEQILEAEPKIIGVNNRNLEDFSVDLSTIGRLNHLIPRDCLLVCESGIRTRHDVKKLSHYGIDAILVGETLMTASDPKKSLKELSGVLKRKKRKK